MKLKNRTEDRLKAAFCLNTSYSVLKTLGWFINYVLKLYK